MLEKVQHRAVRMVSGSVRTARFHLQGKPLGGRPPVPGGPEDIIQFDIAQVFKIIRGFDDVKSSIWFDLMGNNPNRIITRNTNDP